MSSRVERWFAAAGAAAVLCATVAVAADSRRPGADRFPNVTFTTHDGRQVRFYDDLIKGKTVAMNLIYTTCQYACPLETAKLSQVQRLLGDRMGRDIFFYSITIDPEHDTPAVLKEYAEKYHAGPGWLVLTGKKEDVELVSKKLGLYSPPDPARNPDGHIPYLLVGNEATGQWMRNSAVDNPAFIARTIGDWLNSWQTTRPDPSKSYAEVPRLSLTRGQYTFATHCAACHTIGGGDGIGPDLRGVAAARNRAWLSRFIVEPDKMMAERDPIALALRDKYKQVRMPNLGLSAQDAAAILQFVEEQSAAAPAATARTAAAVGTAPATRARSPLSPIVGRYLRIQRALHADALDGIEAEARAIAADAAKLGAGAGFMQAAAEKFQHAGDIKAARAAFAALSDAVITYAQRQKAAISSDVRVAYCPMARKHWLQTGEKVQNPFYGKAMSECGRIVSALPDLSK